MVDFTVVIPVLNQHDATSKYLESWFLRAKGVVDILFIDNGSDIPLESTDYFKRWATIHNVSVHRNEKNIGVYPTFQQGYELTKSKFIFYSHNDVEMIEYGWDEKLRRLLSTVKNPGVCGMFGAKGIGTKDIYVAEYDYRQMMRWDCVTVKEMVDAGARLIKSPWERVIVLDGFSLIINRDFVNNLPNSKFDYESFPIHHMYDIDICVSSHYSGYRNYVLDIGCRHHGGVTSTRENWASSIGTSDLQVHRAAHRVFYSKWRGRLPASVTDAD